MSSSELLTWSVFVREGTFIVPTTYLAANGRRLLAPIETTVATERGPLVDAVLRTYSRGNPELSDAELAALPSRHPLLTAARVRSFRAFDRDLRSWTIAEEGGRFRVTRWVARKGGGQVAADEPAIELPPGSTIRDAANLVFDLTQAELQK